MTRLRVVNLGLPKTGTTTLGHALKLTGMKVADFRIRPRQTENTALHGTYVGELIYRGYFETGDPLAHLGDFDGFSEISTLREGRSLWPQMDFALIQAIRTHHPGVRFLASNRDAFALSQSMLAWSDMGLARLPQGTIPGLPRGYGETSKERMQWIEGHYANLRHWFGTDSDFLEYDVSDPNARQTVSAHIGRPLTWWGKANVNRKTVAGRVVSDAH